MKHIISIFTNPPSSSLPLPLPSEEDDVAGRSESTIVMRGGDGYEHYHKCSRRRNYHEIAILRAVTINSIDTMTNLKTSYQELTMSMSWLWVSRREPNNMSTNAFSATHDISCLNAKVQHLSITNPTQHSAEA